MVIENSAVHVQLFKSMRVDDHVRMPHLQAGPREQGGSLLSKRAQGPNRSVALTAMAGAAELSIPARKAAGMEILCIPFPSDLLTMCLLFAHRRLILPDRRAWAALD